MAHRQSNPMAQAFPKPIDPVTMAERIMRFSPVSDAEALKLLRKSFPDCPLSVRVAALDLLTRSGAADPYSPR
jgi:hypothetical protein